MDSTLTGVKSCFGVSEISVCAAISFWRACSDPCDKCISRYLTIIELQVNPRCVICGNVLKGDEWAMIHCAGSRIGHTPERKVYQYAPVLIITNLGCEWVISVLPANSSKC